MMEHVHEHHDIEALVFAGYTASVERANRNVGLFTDEDIDATDLEIGTQGSYPRREKTVPAADVQNKRIGWDYLCQVRGKHLDTSRVNI